MPGPGFPSWSPDAPPCFAPVMKKPLRAEALVRFVTGLRHGFMLALAHMFKISLDAGAGAGVRGWRHLAAGRGRHCTRALRGGEASQPGLTRNARGTHWVQMRTRSGQRQPGAGWAGRRATLRATTSRRTDNAKFRSSSNHGVVDYRAAAFHRRAGRAFRRCQRSGAVRHLVLDPGIRPAPGGLPHTRTVASDARWPHGCLLAPVPPCGSASPHR